MPNRNVRLEATLTSDTTPLAGKTIAFFYRTSGSATWTSAGTAQTGSDGKATVTVSLTAPQTYDFRAYFAGDDDYEASEAIVSNFKVKAATSITLTVTPL
ncbi:MAG: Ig-like domain-containing protein, partial [Ignisphaera sp.]